MIEIRITPNSPEMMAKVIALLSDINGVVTMAAPKAAPKAAPAVVEEITIAAVQEPAAELPEVTLEQVRAKLADLSQAGKGPAVKDILKNFGATKLTEVSSDKYGELLAAAEAL